MPRTNLACGLVLVGLAAYSAGFTSTPWPVATVTAAVGLLLLGAATTSFRTRGVVSAKLERLKAVAGAATARADARAARVVELKHRAGVLHRAVPDPAVLWTLLPIRARTAAARSSDPAVVGRESRFRATAPAYAEALARRPLPADEAQLMELQGLTWWMPIVRPGDAARTERYLGHQDFPYRALAQTRSIAVGGVMIDIGANIGRMTIPRILLGDFQLAYCAEPDPGNYACLVRNVADNHLTGLVLPDRLAIGATNGTVRLLRARSAGGHRVLGAGAEQQGDTIDVPSLTLDAWTERHAIDLHQLSFVKVDAQGSEVDVLRGAGRVLSCRHVAWQIEVEPQTLAERGLGIEDLFAALRPHFTHFFDLNRSIGGPRVRPISEAADALAYVHKEGRTDVLFFTLAADGTRPRPAPPLRSEE